MMDARWLRPLGVGEVIDAALKIYRARFGTMLRTVAVVVVPVQVINVIVALSLPTTETTTRSGTGFTTTSTSTGNTGAVFGAFVVLQILGIVSSLLATAACLKVVSDAYLGTVTSWRESLRFGMSKLPSILWIGFLSILGVVFGFFLCVVPGVWLYVAWSVAIPALLVEEAKGTKALTRSYNLVRKRWWPTFGALFIAALIAAAVTFALTIITIPLLLSGASFTTTQVATAIARGLATVVTTPFTAAVTALIYFELRVRKEGFDLALMAQRIGVDPPPGGFATAPVPWGAAPTQPWGAPPPQSWGAPPPPGAWTPGPPPPAPWISQPPPPPPPGTPPPETPPPEAPAPEAPAPEAPAREAPPSSVSPWAGITPDPEPPATPPPPPPEAPPAEPPHDG